MTRVGSRWRFTIRLPNALRDILRNDSEDRTVRQFVRAGFGPMTHNQARAVGELAASRCRELFAAAEVRLKTMDDDKDGSGPVPSLASYRDLPAEKRAVVDETIAAATTILQGMKDGTRQGQPPHLAILPIFDSLRALEHTARTQPKTGPYLEGAARAELEQFFRHTGREAAVLDNVDHVLDVPPQSQQPASERIAGFEASEGHEKLFSTACDDHIASLSKRGSMGPKDIRRQQTMLKLFRRVAGDKPVARYAQADIRAYVSVLTELPLRFDADKIELDESGKLLSPICDIPEKRLSSSSINSYIAPVRSVFTTECEKLGIRNPCTGVKAARTRKSKSTKTRPIQDNLFNQALDKAIEKEAFAAIVLLPLGLLTARRIGLLSYMNIEWLERVGDHYQIRPTASVQLPGHSRRTPVKTEESLVPFVLHDELVRIGIVDLLKERGFLFRETMVLEDPAAALSKRINSHLKRCGARGRKFGEVAHGLRSRGITHYRRYVPGAVRLQVGHAAQDEHEQYDWAEIEPDDVPSVATAPLPSGIDLSRLHGFDFRGAIGKEARLATTQKKRTGR